ncbi:hypothetical protein INT45_003958 [Circinella minor]|uniref:CCR4-NOT transcription complex subunit 4 n=1 Tax=Circinella minor TaxID=1195481 RepID=A0A8H7VD56_9FUNG|nr:hypothetical protein INT45_003958 [Circinella minor]
MVSDDEDLDCPLCMEEFDIADRNFRPCPCGYQICRFCWHHIKSNLNGRCPACRRQYSDQIVQFIPVSADEIVRLKKEKKEKERQHKDMKDSNRRHLSNVRVVQKNLVYVLGLSSKYASMEHEFFKKYGKIAKLVVSKRSTTQQSGNQSSVGIYVTYCRKEDAADAIEGINGSTCEGRSLRASYGTTKYCTYYLRHMSCPNPNCMYLHEPGEDVDSYTKDNLNIGKHPSGSGNQTYPNKRLTPTCSISTTTANTAAGSSTSASAAPPPATATSTTQVPTKPLARPSASNDALPAEPPRKSAWAPIPKVAPPPPPPPVVPEPVVETPEPEPEPEPEIQPKVEPELKFEPVVPKKQKQQQREREREREQSSPSPPSQRQESRDIQQPKPSTSGSVSEIQQQQQTKGKNVLEKASKPIAIEKKPALPATASWGKGTNNLSSSHESAATPINFGPSLSDALTAAQKPKHSPSIPRKKEKKLKSKMIRLEDFEEGLRSTSGKANKKQQQKETTAVSSRPAESALSAQIKQQESPWKPIQIPAQGVKPILEPTQQSEHEELPGTATAAPSTQPETTIKEKEKTPSPIVENMVIEEHQVETRVEQKPQAAESKGPIRTETNEEDVTAISEGEVDVQKQMNHYEDIQIPSGRPEDVDEDNKRRDSSADAIIPVEDKTAALDQYKFSPDTVDQPSFANYILGSVMLDNDDRTSEDAFDMEGGLSSLKGDLDSEYDAMAAAQDEEFHQQQRLNALDELERSEKIQEDEHHHHNHEFTSPLLAMEQFSALINQELVQNSPERPLDEFDRRPIVHQQQQQHPPSTLFQDLGLPFDQQQQNQGQQQPPPHQQRAHGPPPGIHGPPEWRSHHFDPFNGQDPAAARRLQHSQQMLEASGLFPGFPPRPPPMFGVSPDFHGNGGTPPPPPPPQGPPPPPGMFGPPPPPPGMMHRPEFMNMPPGLNPPPPPMVDNSDMGNLEQGLHDMNLQQQQQQHNHHQNNNDSLRTMQDNLRALLPNVNISFGPMRPAPGPGSVEESGMIPPPNNNKPHTPSHDEPEFLIQRRPSEHVHPRFDFNQVNYNGEFSSPSREHTHFNSTMSPQRNEEKVFISSNGVPHHKPDAYPEHEHERIQEEQQAGGTHDVKQDAQNFFGEFLRKAAASTGPGNPPPMHHNVPLEEVPRKASLPFQDPAIMSMRMSGEKKTPDMTESQNTILQILGGQQQPPQPPQQQQQQQGETMLLNQAMRSPPEDIFAREIPPKPFDMFTEQHQHPPPPMPFHHHQPPPPPPPPFMSGFMGGMPPPPHHHHRHHQFHHMQDQPPPGMMPMQPPPQQQQQQPIPLQMQMEMEMGYRARNGSIPGGNFPPGLFPNTNTNNNGGGRFDGM